MSSKRLLSAVALGACAAMFLSACGGDSGGGESDGTLTWWHNSNSDPGKAYYEKVAADFEAANPGVKIKISAMAHQDMLTKLDAGFQTGDVPDVYMERGGDELGAHVEAGLTQDISKPASAEITKIGKPITGWQVKDKTYALPFSVGVVGFWYNKALFKKAGITEEPATMDDFNTAVDKLKAAGIQPISVGAKDKWPAAHYWYYFATRECSEDVLKETADSKDFSDKCFIKAGEDTEKLVGDKPFNSGYLATAAQTGPTSASGLLATEKVAMELAGHWEPGVMQGLTEDNKGLGEKTAWFAFPAVDGGQGDPAAPMGGGDAWACSAQAPPECVDFIKYMLSDKVQVGFAEKDMGVPTNPAATGSLGNQELADLVTVRDNAPYVQLYLDTLFGENIGGAMNDSIALMFAGDASPEDIVKTTQAAADSE